MRRVQVLAVALDLDLQPGGDRGVDEHQQDPGPEPVAAPQRLDLDVQVLHLVRPQLPLDGVHPDHPVLGVGPLDQRAQLDRPVGDLQVVERAADIARRHPEHVPHLRVDQDHRPLGVDADDRERGRFQGEILELAFPAGLAHLRLSGYVEPYRRRLVSGHGRAGPPAEHPLPHADDFKSLTVPKQHLRLAEEQIAALAQGEVEPVEDLRLRLDVEVHQRVAAEQQVEPGDRGVAGDVVPAEDDPAPQVRPERELAAGLLEVLVTQLRRHRIQVLRGVDAHPGVTQRVVVDVGAVDLDPFRGFVDPERLGERYGQRVRLLTGGAAGAPHPDLAGRLG